MAPRSLQLVDPPDRPGPTSAIDRARAGELLDAHDLQTIFGIKKTKFYALRRMDAFECFRVHPPIGAKCFSGRLVARYLDGEPIDVPQVLRRRRG